VTTYVSVQRLFFKPLPRFYKPRALLFTGTPLLLHSHMLLMFTLIHSPLMTYVHKESYRTDASIFPLTATKLTVFQTKQSSNNSQQEKPCNTCSISEHFLWNGI